MRLHLPKSILAAVLAACVALPAFGATASLTSETTTEGSTTYSGFLIEYTGGTSQLHSASFTSPTIPTNKSQTLTITKPGSGNTTVAGYTDGTTAYESNSLYYLFAQGTNSSKDHTYGHTLKLNSTTGDAVTMHLSFNTITLGGVIASGSSSAYTINAADGNGNTSSRVINLEGNATSGVNMTIGVDTALNSNGGGINVKTSGDWVITKGKTLDLNSVSGDTTGTLSIAADKSVNVTAASEGTENAILALTGTISNSGTLKIGSGVELVLNGNYSGKTIVNNGTISGTMKITSLSGFDTSIEREDVSGVVTTSGNGFEYKTITIFSGTGSLADSAVVQYNGTDITSSLQDGSTYSYWDKSTYYITEANTTLSIQSLNAVEGVTDPVIINNGATTGTTLQSSADATIGNIVSTAGLTIDVTGGTLTVGANSSAITVTKTGSGTLKYTAADSLGSAQSVLQINGGEVISAWGGQNSAIRGAVVVNAGGKLTLTEKDALGYNNGQTPSITLAGSATDGYAILDLGTTTQTMQTSLALNGYASITGTGNGAFNSWSNAGSTDTSTFSRITVNGNNNEITCKVLVRQGLEVSVAENASLTISGAVSPLTNGQSNAGFKKTGAGLLTITGNTSMGKQLQVQGGTMAVAGTTTTNSLDVDVKVSDGAKLTLAGTTSLNGTLSSVAEGDDASAASTALIAITGGKTTISGGGNGNGNYAGTIRVDQGAELSITSGHSNVLTGTNGKVVVNGTLSIEDKTGVNSAESFYNVSGTGLITSAQSYTETTVDDTTTTTGRLVTINLSSTDAFSGSVTATAGQVKLSGGRAENTLNTITANGGNVVIDSNMSAKTISTSGTSAVSVTTTATLLHDHMTYSGSTISGSNFSMYSGGTVSGGTVTQTGQDQIGYKEFNAKLDGVHFVSNEGTEAHLNNSENSLTDLTVNGTVKLTAKAAVTGNTNVGTNGKLYVASEESSLGAVSGAGTVSSSVKQSVTLARAAEGTGSSFSGTLEATGNQMTVTSVGNEYLSLAGIKANGGSINVMATSGDAISGIMVSVSDLLIGADSTVGVYKGSTVTEAEEGEVYVYGSTDKKGSLTISGTGAKLNADLQLYNTALTLNGVLTMGSTLTLYSGNTLSGSLLDGWDRTQALTLFEGVDGMSINGTEATVDTKHDASTVFDGMTGYSLLMTGGTNGKDYTVQLVQNAPTPEPTTATLSLLALMGLAARRRRRKA